MFKIININYFFLFLFLSSQSLSAKECEDRLYFTFDNREWVEGFQARQDDQSIVEYILKGEKIDDWSELVTVHTFLSSNAPIGEYYRIYMKLLEKVMKPEKVKSRLISKTDHSIFFEWWIPGNSPYSQHEWCKFMRTVNSIILLRYTIKNEEDVEKVRDSWENIIETAHIITDCN